MSAMTAAVGFHGNKYGSVELKEVYRRNWSVALLIATMIHFGVIGSYVISRAFDVAKKDKTTGGIVITPIYIPPPIGFPVLPSTPAGGTKVKPSVGVPIPVPPIEVDPDQTIARQDEINLPFLPGDEFLGTGAPAEPPTIVIAEEEPPSIEAFFEKPPVIIKAVKPEYPELALRAGIQGKVTVRIWVDKEGKARQVEILRTDADIFNEAALAAARQMLFTPALMNNNPVSVWVALPIRFALADRE